MSDEQEIRHLVATWMAATKAGDIETVLSLMAEDVVFLRPGHPPMIGKAAFAAAAGAQSDQGPPKFDGTQSEIQEIKVLRRMGIYVGKAIGRGDSARGCSVDDARRTYAFHPQKAQRQMGLGSGCEYAVPLVSTSGG